MAIYLPEITLSLKDDQWPFEHTDHTREIVRAIVFDKDGYFYFVSIDRDDDFGKAQYIETAGGGVEKSEDTETALFRELKEELGANVEIICKLGVVTDYYNLIHRQNINNYYLCKLMSITENNLTQEEIENFHLSTVRLKFNDAVNHYKTCANTKLGKLVANRELPILLHAKKMLEKINVTIL